MPVDDSGIEMVKAVPESMLLSSTYVVNKLHKVRIVSKQYQQVSQCVTELPNSLGTAIG